MNINRTKTKTKNRSKKLALKLFKKLNNKQGMSIAELLCATFILLLVSMVLVVGVSMALKHFNKSIRASEAQSLYCTLEMSLTNELKYTNSITVAGGTRVKSFRSVTYAIKEDQEVSLVSLDADGDLVDIGELALGDNGVYNRILNSSSYPHGLKAQAHVDYTDKGEGEGYFTVHVNIGTGQDMLINDKTFQVRPMNLKTLNASVD